MSFIETPRFPDRLAYGAVGGPKFKTSIVTLVSGQEQRNIEWARTRGEWDVAHAVKTVAQYDELLHFFMAMRGAAYGFRFKDWLDYQVDSGEGVAAYVAGSPTGQWQLYKRYTAGATTYDRKIVKPIASGFAVSVNGGDVSGFSLDTTTGIVTISGTSGSDTVTWTGTFDVPVRFDTDHMPASIDDLNAITWGQIPIVELKA